MCPNICFFYFIQEMLKDVLNNLMTDNKIFFISIFIISAHLSMIKTDQLAFSVLHRGNLYKSRIIINL